MASSTHCLPGCVCVLFMCVVDLHQEDYHCTVLCVVYMYMHVLCFGIFAYVLLY